MTKFKTKMGVILKCNLCGSTDFEQGKLVGENIDYTCKKCGQVLYFKKGAI